jgi:hypothetical protein
VGYNFSLVLSRQISDAESATLLEAGCVGATFGTDSHPTVPDVTVTKIDFDDTVSSTLAGAIESALEAVKKVPDLSVPSLTVPAQPENVLVAEAEAIAEASAAEAAAEVSAVATPAKKSRAKSSTTKKAAVVAEVPAAEDDTKELVDAGAAS